MQCTESLWKIQLLDWEVGRVWCSSGTTEALVVAIVSEPPSYYVSELLLSLPKGLLVKSAEVLCELDRWQLDVQEAHILSVISFITNTLRPLLLRGTTGLCCYGVWGLTSYPPKVYPEWTINLKTLDFQTTEQAEYPFSELAQGRNNSSLCSPN